MSLSQAWTYLKAHAAKHAPGHEAPADAKAPLGARIGARLIVQDTPVIRAMSAGSLFDAPQQPQDIVRAISCLRLGETSVWRLHTTVPRDPATDDARFVQVFVSEDGAILDAMTCTRLASFTPAPGEVAIYRGQDTDGLGAQAYDLTREQLQGVGLGEGELTAVLGDAQALSFAREVDPGAVFVTPFEGDETRIDDPQGERGLRNRVWFMPYARQLADGSPEFLLIQLTHQVEQDGDSARESLLVHLWIGIPVDAQRIQIL